MLYKNNFSYNIYNLQELFILLQKRIRSQASLKIVVNLGFVLKRGELPWRRRCASCLICGKLKLPLRKISPPAQAFAWISEIAGLSQNLLLFSFYSPDVGPF